MKGVDKKLIQAIVFDVDDTLYDQQAPFKNAVLAIAPLVTAEDMPQLYLRFRYYSDENFPKVMAGELTLEQMRAHRIAQSIKDLDYPQLTSAEALSFQSIYEDELAKITMHPAVTKTLDYLHAKKIPVGIITNGPTDHQAKKIKQLNVSHWVTPERTMISEQTGYQKPQVEIFKLAENKFDFAGEEILYVGDSFESDVTGCKKANWRALWFNHRNRKIPAGHHAIFDVEINTFDQLYSTVATLF